MAKQLIPINYANNDTPITLITLANTIVDTLATEVVTANASLNGALTSGNGYVSGIFGASMLVAGELRGGSVNASANLVLSSNIINLDNSIIIKSGNTIIKTTAIVVDKLVVDVASINSFALNELTIGNTEIRALTFQANASANQTFDTFVMSAYRSAEYLLSMQDTSTGANAYQLMKVLVLHDGGSAAVTEYGLVTTNATAGSVGIIGTINAIANGANVFVTVSPGTAVTNLELQATRIMMGT